MELPGWPRAHDSTIDLLYVSPQSILALFLSGVGCLNPLIPASTARAYAYGAFYSLSMILRIVILC